MDGRTPVGEGCGCLQVLPGTFAQLIQRGKDNLVGISVFTLRVVDRVQAIEQLVKLLVDFAERQGAIDAQLFRRGLLAQTATKPDLGGEIPDAVKQHAVVVGIVTFNQHQHRLRLVKAGEVPEITALAVRIFAIVAACGFRCGKNQRGAARLHRSQQRLTAAKILLLSHDTLQ